MLVELVPCPERFPKPGWRTLQIPYSSPILAYQVKSMNLPRYFASGPDPAQVEVLKGAKAAAEIALDPGYNLTFVINIVGSSRAWPPFLA